MPQAQLEQPATTTDLAATPVVDDGDGVVSVDELIEDVSIDGMCGVY